MDQKAEKTRFSDEELTEFKDIIVRKLERAKDQYEFYLGQLSDMADNADAKIKGLDDGIGTAENERISGMAARQQKLIQHLENALIRVQNKVYGVCRVTGQLISKERLKAVPHATLSIEAKQKRLKK
jgi:RNA polymerase-binding transcription factor DksA